MQPGKVYTAIGLMSGTSLDGIDAALLRTDGEAAIERLAFVSLPYDDDFRTQLRQCFGRTEDADGFVARIGNELSVRHAGAVDWLLGQAGMAHGDVDIVGYHGQTVHHDPANRFTWQIGNAPMLARLTGIDVVADMRLADVAAGGQGAPLLPLYHRALGEGLPRPAAILNLGGVGNVTYLGADGDILAFDTGPGNALLDDWVRQKLQVEYDADGLLARQGAARQEVIDGWLARPYFSKPPPKSLDRDAWDMTALAGLSAADGAATLAQFTVQAVVRARDHLPAFPAAWYVTGGGRHNRYLMDSLRARLNAEVQPVEALGWNGDALEAEGFAYLAVRSLRGLPLSLPRTTGVPVAMTGGRLYAAKTAGLTTKAPRHQGI